MAGVQEFSAFHAHFLETPFDGWSAFQTDTQSVVICRPLDFDNGHPTFMVDIVVSFTHCAANLG